MENTIIPYPYNEEFIVEEVFFNNDNDLSYRGKYKGKNKTHEYIFNSKDKIIIK